jgi:predicted O-linked N-acetylglucosamine transferase (SPINDLY family)
VENLDVGSRNPSLVRELQRAYAAHQAGHLDEAERLYRSVIRAVPNQFDAVHLYGVLQAQRGNNAEASQLLGRAVKVNPGSADALNNHANVLRALGRYREALRSCDRALAIRRDFAEALNNRGTVLHDLGRLTDALSSYDRALAIKPAYAKALANRADVLRDLGRYEEALESCDRALAIDCGLAEALNNRGIALQELGRPEDALASYDRALSVKPGYARALANRARALRALGRYAEARESCARALAIDPGSTDFLNARGDILRAEKRYQDAIACFDRALEAEPRNVEALYSRAEALLGARRYREALESCRVALEVKPDAAQAMNTRGSVLRELGRYEEAIASFEAAMKVKPDLVEPYYNLGELFRQIGKREQAATQYERALALRPNAAEAEFALCVSELPVLYSKEAEIAEQRTAYERRLRSLSDRFERNALRGDRVSALGSYLPFYLAYQGLDDRALQTLYGELACGIMAKSFARALLSPPPGAGERVRIGIVSGYFRRHTVWKLIIKGWLARLDRAKFQLHGYHTGAEKDSETAYAAALCEHFVQGPLSIDGWRKEILAHEPHVLIYPELGMDGVSIQLASQRLANTQCVSWGHPETTGMPTIDYFLSSALMEPPGGERHYTEQLVRLPNLSIYYEPLDSPASSIDRAELGLGVESIAYWSGQSLFKYLPQYDEIYPRIARDVPKARFVFIEHHADSNVTDVFRKRLEEAFERFGLSGRDHYIFLPRLSQERFIAAIGQCDIYLDSVGWSGGNTTLESLEHGLPIVTMRGALMRGRHSTAILERMDVTDTIAGSLEDYVSIAVGLGLDAGRRKEARQRIAERKHRIYRDKDCIAALENFLENTARNGARSSA